MENFCASQMGMGRAQKVLSLMKVRRFRATQDFPLSAAKLCVIYTSGF